MSSQYFYFEGIAEWAQIKSPNKFGNWSINLYADRATRKAIKEAGIRNAPKEGNEEYGDGLYITFRRPTTRVWKGVETQLEAPQVLLADGTPYDGSIGNGSKVTVKVETYAYNSPEFGSGTGSRLVSVRIDELVEYVPEANNSNQQASQQVSGLPF